MSTCTLPTVLGSHIHQGQYRPGLRTVHTHRGTCKHCGWSWPDDRRNHNPPATGSILLRSVFFNEPRDTQRNSGGVRKEVTFLRCPQWCTQDGNYMLLTSKVLSILFAACRSIWSEHKEQRIYQNRYSVANRCFLPCERVETAHVASQFF